jgi:hypothetical protein
LDSWLASIVPPNASVGAVFLILFYPQRHWQIFRLFLATFRVLLFRIVTLARAHFAVLGFDDHLDAMPRAIVRRRRLERE